MADAAAAAAPKWAVATEGDRLSPAIKLLLVPSSPLVPSKCDE